MIFKYQDNCKICAHYLGNQACQAFSTGIPAELWSGKNPHDEPYPGDQGYRYESRRLSIPAVDDEEELDTQPAARHAA